MKLRNEFERGSSVCGKRESLIPPRPVCCLIFNFRPREGLVGCYASVIQCGLLINHGVLNPRLRAPRRPEKRWSSIGEVLSAGFRAQGKLQLMRVDRLAVSKFPRGAGLRGARVSRLGRGVRERFIRSRNFSIMAFTLDRRFWSSSTIKMGP